MATTNDTVLKAIVHHEDGVYWAEVPDLPGCYTQADTLDGLVENLQEAISLYLEDEGATKTLSPFVSARVGILELAA